MRALDKKLWRDLVHMWPQALAIAMVLASGVATLILAIGAYRSLHETRAAYYERYRFADVFSMLKRAPSLVQSQIEQIPGVATVDVRIARYGLLDLDGVPVPASAIALSVPDRATSKLNRVHLREGRLPEPGALHEVSVNDSFAQAHRFGIGSRFKAILNGKKHELIIVGTVLSPEYIYALGPGDIMPDDRRFAVMWMSRSALESLFDLGGAFNSVSIKLQVGATEADVIKRLDDLLARYGGVGAYGRKDQISHAFLDAELAQLSSLARVIPPIFMLVSAFLINMTLTRLIALEREQIGLLKAIGYGPGSIISHYMKMVLLIAVVGIVIGFGIGTWFGTSLTRLYGKFFQFPFLIFQRDADVYVSAAAISGLAAIAGAVRATAAALRLEPAVAMQPPAPPHYTKNWVERLGVLRAASQLTMMSIRNMLRWPLRSAVTTLGVALAVALLVTSMFAFDSVEYMIDFTFFRSERQQATVNFVEKRHERALQAVAHLPGVLSVEPVRGVPVRLRNGHLSRRVTIVGRPVETQLSRVLDTSMRPVMVPEQGLLLNSRLADGLQLTRGDVVEIELLDGRRGTRWAVVSDVIESYFGLRAYMSLDGLSTFLDESPAISGVNITYDTAEEAALFAAVKGTPAIATIELRRVAQRRFRETVAENISMMTSVYIGLAVIVIFGVVYNSARIQLSERARELASLRVLGFSRTEVSRVLLVELAIQVLAAQPLGWLFGYGFSWLTLQGFSSDLYRIPLIIEPATYAKASLVGLTAASCSALLVRRRVDRLDLIAVLKTRD